MNTNEEIFILELEIKNEGITKSQESENSYKTLESF